MRSLRSLVVLFSLGLALGGLGMAEDVGHRLSAGHAEDDDCADECDESGCTPISHACSCCASLRVTAAEPHVTVPSAPQSGEVDAPAAERASRPGFSRRIPRPPTA